MDIPEELVGKLTIDVPTAGRLLGIGRRQAYEAAKSGDLPTLKIGSRILVPVAPFLKLIGVEDD